MILLGALDSIVESLYMSEPLGKQNSKTDIIVNPTNVTYMTGKTIILTDPLYPDQSIEVLGKNGNTIISRVHKNRNGIKFLPYQPRMCSGIMWSGETLDYIDAHNFREAPWIWTGETLYFPKASVVLGMNYDCPGIFGYLLYQVGQPGIWSGSEFQDLDVVKTGKYYFPGDRI